MRARHAVAIALLAVTCGGNRQKLLQQNKGLDIVFVNEYAEEYELFWLGTEGPASMGTIEPRGGTLNMNTYPGHSFGWRQVAADAETCTSDLLEGRVTARRGMERHVLGAEPVVRDVDARKREQERDDAFPAKFINSAAFDMDLTPPGGGAAETVAAGASVEIEVKRGDLLDWTRRSDGELLYRSVIEFYNQRRHAFKWETHTDLCAEATPASAPVRVAKYADPTDGRDVEVRVLREDPYIAYLPNWTTGDECADMEAQAKRVGLSDAQVFGERTVIADRRAMSANLNWREGDPTAVTNRLIERAFAFARDQRNYTLVAGGFQEPLNFIQYAVAGEYRPHCDGVCHRSKYAPGGRVATLIHYCKAATVGGATVFPTAGLKVQPEDGSAVLFAYKRDDGFMDDGNTQHTGCLVREGDKQIVTMWMRENVSHATPWSDFLS